MFFEELRKDDTYEIKGPMGRGLGLTKESKGTFIAFSAGTGILVYIDLVARLALQVLNLIPPEDHLHPDFKFILYTSFQSRTEGMCLDLIEGL